MLKKTIRPEFLNRIDETIMFQPLNKPQIEQIVRLQINGIRKMLEGNGVTLQMTDAAVDFLATAGYDPEFGARPVKRAIQRYLLNDLSKKLLSQEVNREKPIIVEREGDALKLSQRGFPIFYIKTNPPQGFPQKDTCGGFLFVCIQQEFFLNQGIVMRFNSSSVPLNTFRSTSSRIPGKRPTSVCCQKRHCPLYSTESA